MTKATNKQLFALFLATERSMELRKSSLTIEDAGRLIGLHRVGDITTAELKHHLLQYGCTEKEPGVNGEEEKPKPNYQAIYFAAHEAGCKAAEAAVPRPMAVTGSIAGQPFHEVVDDGPCGFAWIRFAGNTGWGRWAKKHADAKKAYPQGLMIWVHQYDQGVTRKEKYAQAFAQVLRDNGIDAWAGSRLD